MIQKRIQDTREVTGYRRGYRIQKHDTEHRIQNTEYRTLEQNTGCRTLDTRWLDQDTGYKTQKRIHDTET